MDDKILVVRGPSRLVHKGKLLENWIANFPANNFVQYEVGQLKMEKIKKSENTKKY